MATSESNVQARIRLMAAETGSAILWRNNSGALPDRGGRLVRFGLGNDSEAVSKKQKSSDLIGIRPRLITPDLIGQTIGQFIAIEVKRPGWSKDDRSRAQQKYIDLVHNWSGIGGIAATEEEAWEILCGY